jgi:hypothetical protein
MRLLEFNTLLRVQTRNAVPNLGGIMKLGSLTALLLVSAIFIPPLANAGGGRSIRSDNPGKACDAFDWVPLHDDPYLDIDGNIDGLRDLATFFQPGTVVTGDTQYVCGPSQPLATVWADDSEQLPNPASKPDPNNNNAPTLGQLTARSGVMFEWANTGASPPLDFSLAPDVEVIVWSLRSGTKLPTGALELELDNWCGDSPFFTEGAQTPPNASSSLSWNGNLYTASCSSFTAPDSTAATDLILNSSGVLLGYVDGSDNMHLTANAPGWTQSLRTTTSLSVSPNPATTASNIVIEGAVANLPGAARSLGAITFYNGSTRLGSAAVDTAGVASITKQLSAGVYTITAVYGGDTKHAASTSAAQTLTVNTP